MAFLEAFARFLKVFWIRTFLDFSVAIITDIHNYRDIIKPDGPGVNGTWGNKPDGSETLM